ncbi:MAG TPA: A24 family peptidase [Candidatus Acidoferrales bacterium]|nr:A24 family peptidase [Candidatus Acidoferrales bacterium]
MGKLAAAFATDLPWVLAVVLTLVAGLSDLRSRRIPNRLTVPALLIGMAVNAGTGGWRGLLHSVEGAAIGLGLLLPVVLLRGLGAGDWKLMGALGSFVGPNKTIEILLISIFMAGGWGIVEMVRQRRVKATLWNLWELVHGFVVFGLQPNPNISIDNRPLIKLPFGAVTAVATAVALSATWLGR